MGPGPRFELGRKAPQASMLPSYTTPATFPCKTCTSATFTELNAWLRYTHSKHLIFVCGRIFHHRCTLLLCIQIQRPLYHIRGQFYPNSRILKFNQKIYYLADREQILIVKQLIKLNMTISRKAMEKQIEENQKPITV
jgi:hypothetical protein